MNTRHARLTVRVRSFNGKTTDSARVRVRAAGRKAAPAVFNKATGAFEVGLAPARYTIEVALGGYETQARPVEVAGDREETFILGKKGMRYYYRGRTRIPFEPLGGIFGVVLKEPLAADEALESLVPLTRHYKLQRTRSFGNFKRDGLQIYRAPPAARERTLREAAEAIRGLPCVYLVAPILKLSERNATLLTSDIVARFKRGVSEQKVSATAKQLGLELVRRIPYVANAYQLRVKGPITYETLDATERLVKTGLVEYAEPDLWHTSEEDQLNPADWLFPRQWDHPIIGAPTAWEVLDRANAPRSFGEADVVIAIVDSGVDSTHPAFSGLVSNGRPKIYKLFDFVNMVADNESLGGSHGTCCAGAAAGRANDASAVGGIIDGTAGIAGNCRVIGIRRTGPESTYADMYAWAAGLEANSALANFPARINPGADVITNSFGSSIGSEASQLMKDTFDTLTSDGRGGKGVLLFFSAGNDNVDLDTTFRRPWGMYEKCHSIAACTLSNAGAEVKAPYSNFGDAVFMCAHSNNGNGRHNPPAAYGAHTATIQNNADGDGNLPGRPTVQTRLTLAAAAGTNVLTVAATAGLAAGQAVLMGNPGAGSAEGNNITAVNAALNRITLARGLLNNQSNGTAVSASTGDYTAEFGGTSYATPVCAGAAALMVSADPALTWRQVRELMRGAAVKIDTANTDATGRWRDHAGRIATDAGYAGPWFSQWYGYGRIDAGVAVARARPPQLVLENLGYSAGGWRVNRHPRLLADIRGIGRSDIVGFGNVGVWVALSNGDGSFQRARLTLGNFAYNAGGWRVERHPRFLADIRGNGRADIIGFGTDGVWVSLSNGDGTFQAPQMVLNNFAYNAGGWRVERHPRFLADIRGIGRSDIVGFGTDGVWVSLSNGDGTFEGPRLILGNLGYDAGGWRVGRHPRFLADVTGDGKADIVGFGTDGVWVKCL